jgi:hypothetical protein
VEQRTGIYECLPVASSQRVTLLERDAAGNVDIEEVDFAVNSDELSGGREDW